MLNNYSFKKNKMLNEREFKTGSLILKSKPTWIQIEPATLCNIYCMMCRTYDENKNWGKLAEPELFEHLYKTGWLKYAELLEINGWGETFLNPQIGGFLEKCKKYKNLTMQITTNGLLLNNHKILSILCELPQLILRFSIDSADLLVYEKIRRGGSWKVLMENIEMLNRIKQERGSRLMKACDCLVHRMNVNDLDKMVDFSVKYGFNSLNFMRVCHCEGLEVSDDLAIPAMERAKEYAKDKKIQLRTYGKYKDKEKIPGTGTVMEKMSWRCERPWKHVLIRIDGAVVPCCYLSNYRCNAVMGNIFKEPLSKIWNSKKYVQLRKSAYKGYPDFCDVEGGGCKAKTKFVPNVELEK